MPTRSPQPPPAHLAPAPTHLSAAASIVHQSRYSVRADAFTITGALPSPLDTHSNNRHTTPNKIASRLGSIPMWDRSRSDVCRPPVPSLVVSQFAGRTRALRPRGAQVAPSWSSRRAALPRQAARRGRDIRLGPTYHRQGRNLQWVLSARCARRRVNSDHLQVHRSTNTGARPGAAQRAAPDMVRCKLSGFDQTPVAHRPFSVEALAPFRCFGILPFTKGCLSEPSTLLPSHIKSRIASSNSTTPPWLQSTMIPIRWATPNGQIRIKHHDPVRSRLHREAQTRRNHQSMESPANRHERHTDQSSCPSPVTILASPMYPLGQPK